MFVFEESLFTLVSGLVVSAGMVGAVPTAAVAQSIEAVASQPPVYLAQAADAEVLTDLDEQPSDPDDLALEGLTDDQIAQIEAIFETYQPQIDGAVADYLAALSVMNDLLVPTTADLALTDAHSNVLPPNRW
ncbi:MAG: hypothetical protein HC929_02155 [Leptolyngbyaceae cyanobacterium SM2_5_2]|nr:hypothetical protein [Leptolyngbyaceae cyanobacterium SM2_5_2]